MLLETAAYNLEMICLQKAPEIKRLLGSFGYNVPVNPETVCAVALLNKEAFTSQLYTVVSNNFNEREGEKLLAAFDGSAQNPEEMKKNDFQLFFDKMVGVLTGANNIVNPEEEEKPKEPKGEKTILGMSPFWFYALLLVVIIIVILIITNAS